MRNRTGRIGQRRFVITAALVVWSLPLLASSGGAAPQSTGKKPPISLEARERVRQAVAAVGQILVGGYGDSLEGGLRPRGSAVIVRKDGVIVTNYHVITEDKTDRPYDEVYFSLPSQTAASAQNPKPYRLQVVLVNKIYDLALLRVLTESAGDALTAAGDFTAIEIGDSRAPRLLDDLIIIGFPQQGGATVTVNTGLVEGADPLDNWIKTDARLIHGNSGGAAVNSEGKLIGIPTRVLADRQPVDKDGDGFPDDYKLLGAVGFLRPAYLVDSMLARLGELEIQAPSASRAKDAKPSAPAETQNSEPAPLVTVRGVVKSSVDGKPVAGARVGLTLLGSLEVTANNLLTWGGTNAEGEFELNKPVPPGRYTLKAKAIKHQGSSLDVEVVREVTLLIIELRPSP